MSPPIALGRSCGECSLCCNLLHVVELRKPANIWCEHCQPGRAEGGCTIYESRPSICRQYACGWLMSSNVGDEWRPLKCRMILSLAPIDGVQVCTVSVDPAFPDAWQREPYYSQLRRMASKGMRARTAEEVLLVQVRSAGRVWLLTDGADIDISRCSYLIKFIAGGQSSVELFSTQEQAQERVDELMQ
jgi:hypothetical protein